MTANHGGPSSIRARSGGMKARIGMVPTRAGMDKALGGAAAGVETVAAERSVAACFVTDPVQGTSKK